MTSSHRLSPGRKGRSVIEHFNTQDVSSFLLFYCRGNSAPKLILISLTNTTSNQFWNPFGWVTPILVRRCGPLRSSLHVCWKSALMAIMPRFLFCLPPISACGHLDTQKILVYHSLKLQLPRSVCPSLFCAIFFGTVLFICFRQLNEKD